MNGQYLTAVFELRPSRRKAAAMERVRAASEGVFWSSLGAMRERAEAVAAIEDPKQRKESWRTAQAVISRSVLALATKVGLPESVAQGIARDVDQSASSYVGLKAGGHKAEWPIPIAAKDADHTAALDGFADATTKDHEDQARDALARLARVPGPRPMTIARSRDATLLRERDHGPVVLALNIFRAKDQRSVPVAIAAGINASTGELTKPAKSATRLLIPVACSKWHEKKFLSGKATLRSSLILRRDDRWFMCAQFEMAVAKSPIPTGARIGVDRGVVNPVAMAVVRQDGSVIATSEPLGSQIGKTIHSAEAKRRAEQKRRGTTSRKHVNSIDDALHQLANRIVSDAKAFGAQVVVEKLDGLKQTIVTKRAKGARKGGWRKVMKAAQLGKLEQIVAYKLNLEGLPAIRAVVAGGTSINCPACAEHDAKNRVTQAGFLCVACSFTAHADTVAGVNIGRRDIAMKGIKKGDKLAPIERDMVARLRLRNDGGLGPLVAGYDAASGLVWTRASADVANEGLRHPLTSSAGQNLSVMSPKTSSEVFAERGDAW